MKLFGIQGNKGDGALKTLWNFGWGLLFVLAMTVLSEWGPRIDYSKDAALASPTIASQPAMHTVK